MILSKDIRNSCRYGVCQGKKLPPHTYHAHSMVVAVESQLSSLPGLGSRTQGGDGCALVVNFKLATPDPSCSCHLGGAYLIDALLTWRSSSRFRRQVLLTG
jgi:hypothetical protein